MLIDDTITAISTPPGTGAIAIVRLSGPDAFAIVSSIFIPRARKNDQSDDAAEEKSFSPRSHQAHIGYIRDPHDKRDLDEVVLIAYQGPNSYTGEDLVEINCHGSPVITKEILSLILKCGARLAERGEFTRRGFVAGRLDLTQAEAVLDLIHSKTERQSRLALSVLTGHLGGEIKQVRVALMELLTRLVAGIDFPEEVGEMELDDVESITESALARIQSLARTARSGRFLREGLRLAIVGRPNAGKSSLLNRLLDFERAIVTDIPGTTRDSIEEPVDVNGIPVILVDTAGVRDTEDVVEKMGIERTTRSIADADLTVVLLDATTPCGVEETVLAAKLEETGARYLVCINKNDLPRVTAVDDAALLTLLAGSGNIGSGEPLSISARNGDNIDAFKSAIESYALTDEVSEVGGSLNERQGALCIRAAEALQSLLSAAKDGLPQDCLVTDLRQAIGALDAISGDTVTEEVITEVFARFCIGK